MPTIDHEGVYVGPRPFKTGQKLYGRDREARELVSLLITQRLVLLHSPSGAGKTSLIQAKLVPAMRKRRFELAQNCSEEDSFPQPVVIRLNREAEEEDPPESNRYILSMLLSLESRLPDRERRSVDELSKYSIDDYLDEAFPSANLEGGAKDADGKGFSPLLLLFDQTEELLTIDPTDLEVKRSFMSQLGKALRNQGRWALFAIREDFLGSLEPYLPAIPTRLTATYHLGLLKAEVAAEAIREPAEAAGVSFQSEVIRLLIEDLRQVRLQEPGGKFRMKAGPYVEPVHLQVICQTLWLSKGEDKVITRKHLEVLSKGRGTGVDEVLAGYYSRQAAEAAEKGGVSERLVRDWFGRSLIGVQKVRLPVLVNEAIDFGLRPECLDVLDKAFLIRRDMRSGAQWYELAHDRLMTPVLNDNDHWRSENLRDFQLQAEVWNDRGKPDGLLLGKEALTQAEAESTEELSVIDEEFLKASGEEVKRREEAELATQQSEKLKRVRRQLYGAAIILSVLGLVTFYAVKQARLAKEAEAEADLQRNEANKQRVKAEWRAYGGLISHAQTEWKKGNPRLAGRYLEETDEKNRGWEYDYLEGVFKADRSVFMGHNASVSDVSFSPNGFLLASSSLDETVRVWDLVDRKTVHELEGNTDWVNSVAFSPDGLRIASGGDDMTIRIWELKGGEWERSQVLGRENNLEGIAESDPSEGHVEAVTSVAWGPRGDMLVSGGEDGDVIAWRLDGEGGNPFQKLKGHTAAVTDVTVSGDGKWIVSCSKDGSVRIWDAGNGEVKQHYDLGDSPLTCLALRPPRASELAAQSILDQFVCGSLDGSFYLLNFLGSLDRLEPIQVTSEAITAINFHQSGEKIVVGDRSGGVFEMVLEDGAWVKHSKRRHTGTVRGVEYHPGNTGAGHLLFDNLIASGGADCLVRISTPIIEEKEHELRSHTGLVWEAGFSDEGTRVVSCSEDGTVKVWKKESASSDFFAKARIERTTEEEMAREGENLISVVSLDTGGRIRVFGPHGKLVVDVKVDHKIPADATAGSIASLISQFQGFEWSLEKSFNGHAGEVWCVDFNPEGNLIASGGTDSTLKIWQVEGPENQEPLVFGKEHGHQGAVVDVVFSPDGRVLASCGVDRTIKIWKTDQGADQIPLTFKGHEQWINSIAFGPEGRWLVSGSADSTLRIWDLSKGEGQSARVLDDHEGTVKSVAISPGGSLIASASTDQTVKLWDFESGEVLRIFKGHTAWVTSVDFHPDGKQLVSGSEDNSLNIWNIESDQEVLSLTGHDDTVWRAVFSPDGRSIVSASQDWTLKIWEQKEKRKE